MKKTMRLLAFALILSMCFLNIKSVLVLDREYTWGVKTRNKQLLNEDKKFDVLFFGGSKVQVGVQPTAIYDEAGIVSFNVATNTQPPLLTKYMVDYFTDRSRPKLVVLDLPGLINESDPNNPRVRNNYILGLQLIDNRKIEKKILEELDNTYEIEDINAYKFDFYRDHARWKNIKKSDFVYNTSFDFFLGGINQMNMLDEGLYLSQKEFKNIKDEVANYNEIALQFYEDTLKALIEKGIDTVILIPPTVIMSDTLRASIFKLANKYNLEVWDFNEKENFNRVKWSERGDFYDATHLSIIGADKFSRVLAKDIDKYLDERYLQSKETYEVLDTYVKQYNDYVESRRADFTFD